MQAVLRSTDFESLIASYVDTSEQRIDRLRGLADNGDLAALAREAHDLKGRRRKLRRAARPSSRHRA
jgi:hypothetical protein